MAVSGITYEVYLDDAAFPPMYGIRSGDGVCACLLSPDYQKVSALARQCTCGGLSPIHLADVAEDFCRC